MISAFGKIIGSLIVGAMVASAVLGWLEQAGM